MDEPELVSLEEAATRLAISRATFWRRLKEWNLTVYENPANRRKRMVSWPEVERVSRPRPMPRTNS